MGNSTSKSEGGGDMGSGGEVSGGKSKAKTTGTNASNANVTAASAVASAAMLKPESTMSRSASGSDVTEKYFTQLVPIEKLSEILKEKSSKSGVNGIVSDVFVVM